jgi:hypothetical protein
MKDFVFVNPLNDLDLNKINAEHMKNVKGDMTFEGETDSGGYYTRYQYASDDVLRKEAASILGNEDVKDKAEDEFMSNENMYKFYRGNITEWYAQQKLKGLEISEGESKFDTRRTPTKQTTTKPPETLEVRQQLQDAAAVALANKKAADDAGAEPAPAPMSTAATGAIVDINGTTNEPGVFTTTSEVIIDGKKVPLSNDKFSPNPGVKADQNGETYVDGMVWVDVKRAQSLVEDTLWIYGNDDRNLINFVDYKEVPNQTDSWNIFSSKSWGKPGNDIKEYGAKPPEVGVNPIEISPEGKKRGWVAKNEIRLGTGDPEPVHMIGIPFKKYFNPKDEFLNTQVNTIQGTPKAKSSNFYETGKYKFTMTYDGSNWGRNAETEEWVEIE